MHEEEDRLLPGTYVARTIDSSGDIETISKTDPAKAGEEVRLVFRAEDDAEPPFTLKIKSPSGQVIVERVIRDLPTGKPQSAPPVAFTPSSSGEYKVEIRQLKGKQKGDAVLRVTE
jgi:hypothetical protein